MHQTILIIRTFSAKKEGEKTGRTRNEERKEVKESRKERRKLRKEGEMEGKEGKGRKGKKGRKGTEGKGRGDLPISLFSIVILVYRRVIPFPTGLPS